MNRLETKRFKATQFLWIGLFLMFGILCLTKRSSGDQDSGGQSVLKPGDEMLAQTILKLEETLKKDPTNSKVSKELTKARARQQKLSDAFYKNGLIAYSQGNLGEAMRQCQIAVRINPQHDKARQLIWKARAELGT